MSTIARRIAATPKRTAVEAWQVISGIIADQSSPAKKILDSITGVVSAIISDEIPQEAPFVIVGSGPRLKIYCEYGDGALSEDNCNEDPLVQKPVLENWRLYIPSAAEDITWITSALTTVSTFVTAYDKDKELEITDNQNSSQKLTINKTVFLNKP